MAKRETSFEMRVEEKGEGAADTRPMTKYKNQSRKSGKSERSRKTTTRSREEWEKLTSRDEGDKD